jgi:hypothetical protein
MHKETKKGREGVLRRRHYAVLILALALSLGCLLGARAPQVGAQREGAASTVLFVVSANKLPAASITPILIIEQGAYKEPVAGDSSAEEISRFAADYYQKGRKYRVLFGGSEAGSLTVKRSTKDEECMRTEAEVALQSPARLNTNVMALATNSDALGREPPASRRAPTASERAAMLPLARSAFKQKGVPDSLLPSLDTVNLTAMDLNADGKAELIGSYIVKKIKGGQERYVLFLLAEPQGKGYTAGLTQYAQYKEEDIMSGGDIDAIGQSGLYTERLVDQIDLDQSGVAEVVTITNGFEGDSYMIYSKKSGGWQKIYEFGKYRCAF